MEQRTVNSFFKITMVSVVIIILILFVFSIYYNIELSSQIEDRNKVIDNLTVQNDLLNQVIPFEIDSTGRQYYIFLKSDSNKIYTYDQLYDIVKKQTKIIQKQDTNLIIRLNMQVIPYLLSHGISSTVLYSCGKRTIQMGAI